MLLLQQSGLIHSLDAESSKCIPNPDQSLGGRVQSTPLTLTPVHTMITAHLKKFGCRNQPKLFLLALKHDTTSPSPTNLSEGRLKKTLPLL